MEEKKLFESKWHFNALVVFVISLVALAVIGLILDQGHERPANDGPNHNVVNFDINVEKKAEERLKEINSWYEVNDDTLMGEETKAEVESLIEEALEGNSGYAALLKAYSTIPEWRDAGPQANQEARELLIVAANSGYAEAMYQLARLEFLGLSDIERYSYLKLSDFTWGLSLGSFNLEETEIAQAEKAYQKMKNALTSFYARGEEHY